MDFNPIDVQQHLKGADYPATREDLASTAESNNAPNDLVEQLRNLPDQQFSGPDEVMSVLYGEGSSGTFGEHPPSAEHEGVTEPGDDPRDEDELRVQRTEEELRTGTRERKAGTVDVRKRVHTDREQVEVPTRREEVTVERVPVEGEASEAEIGEDEISVPITEEEAVVEKRPVAKEEIRVRKDVVEDTEVVEEDVRREEVDIDEGNTRRTR